MICISKPRICTTEKRYPKFCTIEPRICTTDSVVQKKQLGYRFWDLQIFRAYMNMSILIRNTKVVDTSVYRWIKAPVWEHFNLSLIQDDVNKITSRVAADAKTSWKVVKFSDGSGSKFWHFAVPLRLFKLSLWQQSNNGEFPRGCHSKWVVCISINAQGKLHIIVI